MIPRRTWRQRDGAWWLAWTYDVVDFDQVGHIGRLAEIVEDLRQLRLSHSREVNEDLDADIEWPDPQERSEGVLFSMIVWERPQGAGESLGGGNRVGGEIYMVTRS